MLDLSPLKPVEKRASSDWEPECPDRERSLPLGMLGGGVTKTSWPRDGPLDIVTGEPVRALLFAFIARANSWSRSPVEPVRRREFPRLGGI